MPEYAKLITKNKNVILYGLSLAILLFLLKWLELRYLMMSHSFEVYTGAIAIIFTILGIWLALKLSNPGIKTIVIEKEIQPQTFIFIRDDAMTEKLQLSKRELEVLEKIAAGLSNQEIADVLFVSLNTIKTHTTKVFEKLEVKRRTQAIETAKRLRIIP